MRKEEVVSQKSMEEVDEELVNKLDFKICTEDKNTVAKAIHEREEIDGIYALKGDGLLDSFYEFLKQVGFMKEAKLIKAENVKRIMIGMFKYIMMYMLKVLMGIQSINETPVLLTNVVAMKMVGFNANQVREGICERGKNKRDRKRRGVINPVTLSNNIIKIPLKGLERLYNTAIKLISKMNIFPPNITLIIDGSDLETTEKYEGCGMARRDKAVKNTKEKVSVRVFGFKLMAAFESTTKIPIAIAVDKINCDEREYIRKLVIQSQKNVKNKSKIERVVMDRGFIDGKELWWLNSQKIKFVIPARSGMNVKEDALKIAFSVTATDKKSGIYVIERVKKTKHGKGKNAIIEHVETSLVGVSGLTSYAQYRDNYTVSMENRSDFESNEINAVVVKKYENKETNEKCATVFLTNEDVSKPFVAYDKYDDRSIIENCLFKESKQAWNLKSYPSKTEKGVKVHIIMTMLVFALVAAYRFWNEKDNKLAESESLGIARWKRKIMMENQDKAIVFYKDNYAVLFMAEIMMLSGFKIKDKPEGVGDINDVLGKYGLCGN
jgi:hypothetical protein